MAGIYFHIPFCKQACHYCDFHFSTNRTQRKEMVNALGKELRLRSGYINEPVETIYFGGGTPSLLPADEISALLEATLSLFTVRADVEITLEANPDDLSETRLRELRASGINRLSIGIQSFDDSILKFLNRVHDKTAAMQCVDDAREAGFTNISLDLIYAIPGQSDNVLMSDIQTALQLSPEHISAYSLTIEDKTVFGKWAAHGKISAPTDDHAAEHLARLVGALEDHGYEQYEISNFAKPGYYSKHNSSYWKGVPYLGIGPGAHSFNVTSRQANISNNAIYLKEVAVDTIPATVEILTVEDKVNDYLLTTLRTNWGTDLIKLKEDFNIDLLSLHRGYVQRLIDEHLAELKEMHLVLTKKGKMIADKICSDLFVSAIN